MKTTNYFLLAILSLIISCSGESIKCDEDFSPFNFDVDFSDVLDHSTTDNTTHIKIYYEDYFAVGNLKGHEMYVLNDNFTFKTEVCLPINNHPIDSIIIGLRLIQNNMEINNQPTVYFQMPLVKNETNEIQKKVSSLDLWDRPSCDSVPVVFQNLEDFIEGEQYYNISVAGGFGVSLEGHNTSTPAEIAAECKGLIQYYQSGVCPCSKCYIRFY